MAPLKKHPLYSWLSIGVGITSLVTAMIFVMMAYRTGGRIVRPAVHAPYNRWIAIYALVLAGTGSLLFHLARRRARGQTLDVMTRHDTCMVRAQVHYKECRMKQEPKAAAAAAAVAAAAAATGAPDQHPGLIRQLAMAGLNRFGPDRPTLAVPA